MLLTKLVHEVRQSVPRINVWIGTKKKSGSGFFVSEDGRLVTCEHVIRPDGERPDKIEVAIENRPPYSPDILYSDPSYDLAVLKIDEKTKPIPVDSYTSAAPGDDVVFFGYPIGVPVLTVHKGIISAIGKGILRGFDCDLLQIDATINLGNSGGPLIKLETRKVIGVITTKYGLFLKDVKDFGQYVETIPPIPSGVAIMGVDFGSLVNFTKGGFDRLARALVLVQVGIGYAVPIDFAQEFL